MAEAAAMVGFCDAAGAPFSTSAGDDSEASYFVELRRMAYPALQRLGDVLLDDVCVPPAAIPALLGGIESIGTDTGARIATFGHAADGNMHPTILFDAADDHSKGRAREAFDRILELALKLDGTVTGEHGVGLLKRDHLGDELGARSLSLQRNLRHVFDPEGILNPGKVLHP